MVRLTALFTSVRVLAATFEGATKSGLIETVAEPGDGRFTDPASRLPPACGAAVRRRAPADWGNNDGKTYNIQDSNLSGHNYLVSKQPPHTLSPLAFLAAC